MRTLYPMWEFQWGKSEGLFAYVLHMNLNTMSYNDTLTYNVLSLQYNKFQETGSRCNAKDGRDSINRTLYLV